MGTQCGAESHVLIDCVVWLIFILDPDFIYFHIFRFQTPYFLFAFLSLPITLKRFIVFMSDHRTHTLSQNTVKTHAMNGSARWPSAVICLMKPSHSALVTI